MLQISVHSQVTKLIAPKVLYDQLANTYGGLQKACHVYLLFITFVWLFGALVSMRAIDHDLQEIFWDLAVYGKVFKKIFRERARPGDGRSDLQPTIGSWKSGFCWDTGLITERLRLVIMTILDVFGMD